MATESSSDKPITSQSKGSPSTSGKKSTISMLAMTVMIITTVLSLRGLASQAEFGISSIFYYIFAALVFLIPFSLVLAELVSTFTKSGGLFRWVWEGLGARWGWAAL